MTVEAIDAPARAEEYMPAPIIQTGEDLRRAREEMGLGWERFAKLLRMCPVDGASEDQRVKQAAKRVREMEIGTREITGPISVAAEAMLTGFRPSGAEDVNAQAWPALDRETIDLLARFIGAVNKTIEDPSEQLEPSSPLDCGEAVNMALRIALEDVEKELQASG